MIFVQCALLLVYLVICSVSPGLLVLRRFRLSSFERLAMAMPVSSLMTYLAAFGIFAFRLDPRWNYVTGALFAICAIVCWRDWLRLIKSRSSRQLLMGYGILVGWLILGLILIRSYSGADWAGDWIEHYQRSLFLLNHPPPMTRLIGMYYFPARPPLMNAIASFYLAQFGQHYYVFQLVFSTLNAQIFLACALVVSGLLRSVWPGRSSTARSIWVLVGLLMMSPFFVHNCTYAWTKTVTAGYVILGLWLYCRGWRRNDSGRIVLSFVVLATAILSHYTAAPFALFVWGHYALYQFWRRSAPWLEAATGLLMVAAIFATWFGWSWATYRGLTFEPGGMSESSIATKFIANLYTITVPFPFRGIVPPGCSQGEQGNYGRFRDYFFSLYECCLIPAMGLAGGVVAVWLAGRSWRQAAGNSAIRSDRRWFWMLLLLVAAPLAVASVAEVSTLGQACLVLQPVIFLGLSLLAAGSASTLPRWVRWGLAMGLACDFVIGVLIHLDVQSVVFSPEAGPDGSTQYVAPLALSRYALRNWFAKTHLRLEFVGDLVPAEAGNVVRAAMVGMFVAVIWWLMARGWKGRLKCRIPTRPQIEGAKS